jgi:hypothetical protein
MARTKDGGNGQLDAAMAELAKSHAKLEEAMVKLQQAVAAREGAQQHLIETQALFVQNQAAFQAHMAHMDRENAERFGRIESILLQHSHILAEHTRILEALPEAVRQKIGFKPPAPV